MTDTDARVFIVDDDASVRTGLKRLLASAGYVVETFDSAQAYLERGRYDGVGCLILDLRMPGMDGLDLQSRLNDAASDIPIVFLTGHGDVPTGVGAIKSGAIDFLTKPVEDLALFAAVDEAVHKHRQIRASKMANADVQRRLASLSTRELEVMRLLLSGALNKQVAAELGISEKTVKAHRKAIMTKLAVSSAAELGRICAQAGIPPERVGSV